MGPTKFQQGCFDQFTWKLLTPHVVDRFQLNMFEKHMSRVGWQFYEIVQTSAKTDSYFVNKDGSRCSLARVYNSIPWTSGLCLQNMVMSWLVLSNGHDSQSQIWCVKSFPTPSFTDKICFSGFPPCLWNVHCATCFLIVSSGCFLQQARAEQEEEFISNTLMKKIQDLKKEKESLAMNYEQEEEFLTNDLSRKLLQVSYLLWENSHRFSFARVQMKTGKVWYLGWILELHSLTRVVNHANVETLCSCSFISFSNSGKLTFPQKKWNFPGLNGRVTPGFFSSDAQNVFSAVPNETKRKFILRFCVATAKKKYIYIYSFTLFPFLQLRQEKVELEQTLEKEQEYQVNKLMRKIEKLEADTVSKQNTLEQVRLFSRFPLIAVESTGPWPQRPSQLLQWGGGRGWSLLGSRSDTKTRPTFRTTCLLSLRALMTPLKIRPSAFWQWSLERPKLLTQMQLLFELQMSGQSYWQSYFCLNCVQFCTVR